MVRDHLIHKYMGKFHRGNKRDSRRSSGFSHGGMHQAICDECGEPCEVPFRPTGDRPVYCSSCFENQGGGSRERHNKSRDFGSRDSRRSSAMYQAVCDQCGSPCEVPFKPTQGKPIYCDDCFGKNKDKGRKSSDRKSDSSDSLKKELASLNVKLDKILQVITSTQESKKVSVSSKLETTSSKADKVVIKEANKESDGTTKTTTKKVTKPVDKKVAKKVVSTKKATKESTNKTTAKKISTKKKK